MEMYAGSVERIAHYAQQQPEVEEELEEEEEEESESEVQQKQDVVEISNEVDRSRNPCAVDKVYPGATSAAVDVDGDTAGAAGSNEDADKLNAGNANGNGNVSCNHLNLQPASVVDKLQQATTSRMIKDKRMTTLGDKVALSNEPARRIKICE